jgi:hypothetical protein
VGRVSFFSPLPSLSQRTAFAKREKGIFFWVTARPPIETYHGSWYVSMGGWAVTLLFFFSLFHISRTIPVALWHIIEHYISFLLHLFILNVAKQLIGRPLAPAG